MSSERSDDQIIEGTCCDSTEGFTHKCDGNRDSKVYGTKMQSYRGCTCHVEGVQ